ncbi:hypothetical protein [Shouchella shacheensis]|uniref:hypothetical protein n=1 Tax=Shouchella shacheensis TaxID=1649580 RepID=UPI0007402386|nr:hypothetical protein [Shouchella shacheensis]
MIALILFWGISIASVIATIKWKKPLLLTVPFAAMGLYMVVEMARVPLPFWETVQMVFDLK